MKHTHFLMTYLSIADTVRQIYRAKGKGIGHRAHGTEDSAMQIIDTKKGKTENSEIVTYAKYCIKTGNMICIDSLDYLEHVKTMRIKTITLSVYHGLNLSCRG